MWNGTDLGGLYNTAVHMVLAVDGSSEHNAHVLSELNNLTCLRRLSTSFNSKFASLYMCANRSEIPSNISSNCVYQIKDFFIQIFQYENSNNKVRTEKFKCFCRIYWTYSIILISRISHTYVFIS